MGHYYSEMVSDSEIEERERIKREQRAIMASKIRDSIDEHGIEYVLADLADDPVLFSIRHR